MSEARPVSKGLEDVVVGTSSICYIDGKRGRLLYRGYDIKELAERSSYEEVAYLLWHGRLPKREELEGFKGELKRARTLEPKLLSLLRLFPREAHPMHVLRTAVSALSIHDPDEADISKEANLRKGIRLLAKMPSIVATFDRLRRGLDPLEPLEGLDHAANFLYMLHGREPDERFSRIFDICLVLQADHEFNASTFAARVTVSTLSDLHSAITSALGALKGPLHGGANMAVMKMLDEIGEVDRAERWVLDALAQKKRIMGFGHRVYKTEDPRATILRELSREVCEKVGKLHLFEMSRIIEEVVRREKGLYPNVDFYASTVYHGLGIPTDLFTCIFAISRIAGWVAHVLEQYQDNRLIRPLAEYVGPMEARYVPLEERQ